MASTTHSTTKLMSVAEYLKSEFEPDAEYVDGEIEGRAVPEYDHADWQLAICQWFLRNKREWNIRVLPELRVRVSSSRFRIPDVTVLDREFPIEQIITKPPLAVFEILSPEDTFQRLLRKLKDYEWMGVPEIWIVDPETRVFSRYQAGQLLNRSEFSLPGKNIHFLVKEIEALLD